MTFKNSDDIDEYLKVVVSHMHSRIQKTANRLGGFEELQKIVPIKNIQKIYDIGRISRMRILYREMENLGLFEGDAPEK